jgi:hypothetical protein
LRQRLIIFKFDTAIERIKAVKALKVCIKEGQQGQSGFGKQKDMDYSSGRPLILKKGKGHLVV